MSSGVKDFFRFFAKRLRLSNPWNYKVPFLITIPYLVFFISENKLEWPVLYIGVSLMVIIGVAGIGYLTNDLGDKQKDKLQGKYNVTEHLGRLSIAGLFFIFFFLMLAPWWFLPFNRNSGLLLVIEVLLFFLYAFSPFRLKERGLLGIVADALYAHALPAGLAAYTFYLLIGGKEVVFYFFIGVLLSWQFTLGLRNILFHQIQDFENDRMTNTETYVTKTGINKSESIVKIVLYFELVFFMMFVGFCSYINLFVGLSVLLFWSFSYFKQKDRREIGYRLLAYKLLDDLYIQWFPVFILSILSVKAIAFVFVFVLHLVLFKNGLKGYLIQKLKP